MAKVLDLKVFKPEKRTFRLHDGDEVREIDVSRVPTDAVISILDNLELLEAMQRGKVDREAFEMLLGIAVATCRANDEEVTRDYLLDKLDVFGVVELIQFVIEPVLQRLTEGGKDSKKKSQKT